MINQTKQTVNALVKSGLKRNEFRVRTECKRGEYGETFITLFCSTQRAVDLTPAIVKNGLNVQHYIERDTQSANGQNDIRHVSVTYSNRPFGSLKANFLPPKGCTR